MIIRLGSTISAIAPAGRVNRNIGKVTAAWTSDTSNGLTSSVVISQPEAVSYIAMPTSAQVLAVQTIANAGGAKAPSQDCAPDAGSWGIRKSIFDSLLAPDRRQPSARPTCSGQPSGEGPASPRRTP